MLSEYVSGELRGSELRDEERLESVISELKSDASFQIRRDHVIKQRLVVAWDNKVIDVDLDPYFKGESHRQGFAEYLRPIVGNSPSFCNLMITRVWFSEDAERRDQDEMVLIFLVHADFGRRVILGDIKKDKKGRPKKIKFEAAGEETYSNISKGFLSVEMDGLGIASGELYKQPSIIGGKPSSL